jgi:beta-mannanase
VNVLAYMGNEKWMSQSWWKDLYPGDDVVDWIGYDPFAKSNVKDYANLVNKVAPKQQDLGFPGFYEYADRNLPDKPLMLSEWAVLEVPGDAARKATFFESVAEQFADYPRIKAMTYYNARHAANMPDGGNTTVDATPDALKAFRTLSRRPEFNVRH